MELDADKVFTYVEERDKKHDMMLDLSLSGQKSENLFGDSDQTPTPTRLIRNCEEVGLFEDLRHVNPFEETFRRAVEQNNSDTPIRQLDSVEAHVDEDSLHTPQVYPQLEPIHSCEMLAKPLDSPSSAAVTLDVPAVDELLNAAADAYKIGTSRQNSNASTASSSGGYSKTHKCLPIAEKPAATALIELSNDGRLPYMHMPTTTIQLIQPQVITLSFPDNTPLSSKSNTNEHKQLGAAINAIPIQTVKPFIMPKLAPAPPTAVSAVSSSTTKPVATPLLPLSTATVISDAVTSTSSAAAQQPQQQQMPHEPSSASLTPTSQLPIKERLKAILSHGHKTTQQVVPAQPTKPPSRRMRSAVPSGKYDEDSMVRRRAAATRYRNKMRNEHKELRQRNVELQTENDKLRSCVKQLKLEMSKLQQQQQQQQILVANGAGGVQSVPAQLQIPPSTLRLVMNIPTMLVPASGQPTLAQPITYRVEKK